MQVTCASFIGPPAEGVLCSGLVFVGLSGCAAPDADWMLAGAGLACHAGGLLAPLLILPLQSLC